MLTFQAPGFTTQSIILQLHLNAGRFHKAKVQHWNTPVQTRGMHELVQLGLLQRAI
jgi:hypothetical protein